MFASATSVEPNPTIQWVIESMLILTFALFFLFLVWGWMLVRMAHVPARLDMTRHVQPVKINELMVFLKFVAIFLGFANIPGADAYTGKTILRWNDWLDLKFILLYIIYNLVCLIPAPKDTQKQFIKLVSTLLKLVTLSYILFLGVVFYVWECIRRPLGIPFLLHVEYINILIFLSIFGFYFSQSRIYTFELIHLIVSQLNGLNGEETNGDGWNKKSNFEKNTKQQGKQNVKYGPPVPVPKVEEPEETKEQRFLRERAAELVEYEAAYEDDIILYKRTVGHWAQCLALLEDIIENPRANFTVWSVDGFVRLSLAILELMFPGFTPFLHNMLINLKMDEQDLLDMRDMRTQPIKIAHLKNTDRVYQNFDNFDYINDYGYTHIQTVRINRYLVDKLRRAQPGHYTNEYTVNTYMMELQRLDKYLIFNHNDMIFASHFYKNKMERYEYSTRHLLSTASVNVT